MSDVSVAAPAAVVTPVVDVSAGATGVNPPASGSGAVAPVEPSWMAEKIEITVNGNKKMVTVKEARDLAQKASGADDQFRTAKAKADQVEAVLKEFGSDPEGALKKLGFNPDEISDAMSKRRADAKKLADDDAKLTPEQRELKQLRADKAERERLEAETKTKKEERAQEIKDKLTLTTVSNKIEEYLTKLGMPKTKNNVYLAAKAMEELNVSDENFVNGKFSLDKLLENMMNIGNNHLKFSTQNYEPARLHKTVGDEAGAAYVKWYLQNIQGKSTTEKDAALKTAKKQKRTLVI